MPESYTGACSAVQSTMQSCASRIDSLRTECTKSYGTLTAWPGPCECTYCAQDLMCFDEQELCASQAWSQVPAWFRDGVTSCLAKDENYTVRAQLGTYSDPFKVAGLAGSLATTTGSTNGTGTSSTASPGATISGPTSSTAEVTNVGSAAMSGGAIAGVVVGCTAGLALVAVGAYLLYRRRKSKLVLADKETDGTHELHAQSAVCESDNKPLYEKQGVDVFELPQHEPAELYTEEHAVEVEDTERDRSK